MRVYVVGPLRLEIIVTLLRLRRRRMNVAVHDAAAPPLDRPRTCQVAHPHTTHNYAQRRARAASWSRRVTLFGGCSADGLPRG
ncbi:Hypothetical protein NTJ_03503 [Nesidiocoris tenuis]|uniref:Secreted protein n=1 Tax=Nesidiocoris tenuis TaxID=355587 RepID=A0ABN7AEI1_9HEMI|nr:Hypothetical protein NTJ_03503 [Nesidiocoris tenuis]